MNAEEYYRSTYYAREHEVLGLPALISASFIIFLSFIRIIYRFIAVTCLFAPLAVTIYFKLILYYFYTYFLAFITFSSLNCCIG
jgi:hypothetical protein